MKKTLHSYVKSTKSFVTALAITLFLYSSAAQAQVIWAVSGNNLIWFNASTPGTLINNQPITGLGTGQTIEGLDFRPATGELFLFAYNRTSQEGQLYRVNRLTGVSTAAGAPFLLNAGTSATLRFGFDFNPTVDRIRLVTNEGKNFRLNPITGGLVQADGDLKYATGDPNFGTAPKISAAAYTNSFISATRTQLFVLDESLRAFAFQNPPNDGVLNTLSTLDFMLNTTDLTVDMDIWTNPTTGVETAFLAANPTGATNDNLYSVNIQTGATTNLGAIGSGLPVQFISARIVRDLPAITGKLLYGRSTNNNLISFDSANPGFIRTAVPITGITTGETVVGMDFRPLTGELWALGYNRSNQMASLYTLNLSTGAATLRSPAPFMLPLGTGANERIGFDFNPTVDRIRVISTNGANFRLNPNNGQIAATDGPLKYNTGDPNFGVAPRAGTGGYTNSYIASTATTLYDIDINLNILAIQTPPNDGGLQTLGPLGITINSPANVDFDIDFDSASGMNIAYLNANSGPNAFSKLYTVNLTTGAATEVGSIGLRVDVSNITTFIDRTLPANVGQLAYGLITNNRLISFDLDNPSVIRTEIPLAGIPAGQTIEGMDYRPQTGELYAFGYNRTNQTGQLFIINPSTGNLTPVSPNTFSVLLGTGADVRIGFDFNPTVDRIRLVSNNGRNYRLNPITGGLVQEDGMLSYNSGDANFGTPARIGAVGYTNSYIASTATALYDIDEDLNILALQTPPNDGGLNTIGSLGITINKSVGYDADITNKNGANTFFLVAANGSATVSSLYTVNLTTGAATLVTRIGNGSAIRKVTALIERNVPEALVGNLVYGVTSNNNLITFDSQNPGIIRTATPITGIVSGQILEGADFRPATGELWAFGYNRTLQEGRLYIIDLATGVATPQGPTNFVVALGSDANMRIGFDFNPTVDRIRLVSSNRANFRLNPITGGVVASDGPLGYASGDANSASSPRVGAGAYTNSLIAATNTSLFVIDEGLNIMAFQNPPNDGILNTVGGLGITLNATAGYDFDIFFDSNSGSNIGVVAAADAGGMLGNFHELYTINLSNGSLTKVGKIGGGLSVRKISNFINRVAPLALEGELMYGLTSGNQLITFDSEKPEFVRSAVPVTGIMAGHTLEGLDSRPATGELFAFSYNRTTQEGRLYTVNPSTGVATALGPGAFGVALGTAATVRIGFDFNPTVDRIRLVSTTGANFRLNPITGGLVQADGSLSYNTGDANNGTPARIGAVGYTNSYIASTSTSLFDIDENLNILAFQNPPNNGGLNTVGSLGITINPAAGYDLDVAYDWVECVNIAYLAAATGSSNAHNLYRVNTASGATTLVGAIGGALSVRKITAFIDRTVPQNISGQLVYGVTTNNNLVTFATGNPRIIRTATPITGVAAGQVLVGLDVRPNNMQLFGFGYNATNGTGRIYTINPTTAAATPVGSADIMVDLGTGPVTFDFNPTVDRIRLMGTNGKNFRLHPDLGTLVATDGNLAYAMTDPNNGQTPRIVTGAYTRSFGGSGNTRLLVYDGNLNILAFQNPPNNGTLNTVGPSGLVLNGADMTARLDIYYDAANATDTAFFAANTVGSGTFDNLYKMNLENGSTTLISVIGNGIALRNITIAVDAPVTSVRTTEASRIGKLMPVFPNPIVDVSTVRVSLAEASNARISLMDMLGKEVLLVSDNKLSAGEHQFKIDATNLNNGIYFLQLMIDGVPAANTRIVISK